MNAAGDTALPVSGAGTVMMAGGAADVGDSGKGGVVITSDGCGFCTACSRIGYRGNNVGSATTGGKPYDDIFPRRTPASNIALAEFF